MISFYSYEIQFKLNFLSWLGDALTSSWSFLFTSSETSFFFFCLLSLLAWTYWGRLLSGTMFIFALGLTFPLGLATYQFLNYPVKPLSSLFNGVLFFHPPLLYLAWGFSLVYLSLSLNTFKKNSWFESDQFIFCYLNLVLIAAGLGGLWAQQELNWGGWWSWDLVELGTLLLVYIALNYLHNPISLFSSWSFAFINLKALFFFWLALRYGLFNSIHAFLDVSNVNWITGAQFYVFFLFFFFKPKGEKRNLGFLVLYSLNLVIFYTFGSEFLTKYFSFISGWSLNKLSLLIFFLFFTTTISSYLHSWACGLFPFYLSTLFLNWTFKLRASIVHLGFLFFITGLSLLRLNWACWVMLQETAFEAWVSHLTYLAPWTNLSWSFPLNWGVFFGCNFTIQSLGWLGYFSNFLRPEPIYLSILWVVNFQPFLFLGLTMMLTALLGFSSLYGLFLIKKSFVEQN